LLDMLTAAQAVDSFIRGKVAADLGADLLLRSAIERQIEIIGEAASGVSNFTRDKHREIAWRAIIAQRHRLAHDYGSIRIDLLWEVASVHVPTLIQQLEPVVRRLQTPGG
jgi:uncharacterized protein with HEPN domain